jgi:hypothetical protein
MKLDGVNIEAIRPSGHAHLDKDARKKGLIMERLYHCAPFLDQRPEVMLANATVRKRKLQTVTPNGLIADTLTVPPEMSPL